MQRRDFLKLSATAGAVSCLSACGGKDTENVIPEVPADENVNFSACLVNCGSNCPLKIFSQDGRIVRVETDHSGTDQYGDHQVRACLRGRSIKQRTYAADRLKAPMKRKAGTKRGAGMYEEITWEQAFAEIGQKVMDLQGTYGPRSIYHHYGSGAYYGFASSSCVQRALRLSGGHLNYYGNYSWAQLNVASPATFGTGGTSGTRLSEIRNSDLVVGFGFNPFEIRMSGSGEQIDFLHAIETRRQTGDLEVIIVDPRYTDTTLGKEDQWLPIRPGTDGALAEAIAYQMISTGWVDQNSKAFLDKHAIGYDKASLEQAKVDNPDYAALINSDENYHDYIMGVGIYSAPRTPEWAAAKCGVPARQIEALADKIMNAKTPYITIGAGCNRHACGEQTMRALYMLPILTGKLGESGVNNGELPRNFGLGRSGMGAGSNPESASICFHTWAEAIERGEEMDALSDGVKGLAEGEKLGVNIKAVFSSSGNALINQHSEINHTRQILEDESKCELIVVTDCWMTASARFADYILPDTTWVESNDLANDSYASGETGYLTFMSSSLDPLYNCRNLYQIGLGLAKVFGKEAEYTEGRSEQEWLEHLYQGTVSSNPELNLPATYSEAQKVGFYRRHAPDTYVALKDFVKDGKALSTPSGKIEIYSLDWAKKRAEWIPASDKDYDQITPLPHYTEAWQGFEDTETRDEYPLQVVGYHTKGRAHSSYHNVEWLREAVEDAAWFNPADAAKFGISKGQMITLTSPQGAIRVRAKITPRVMMGVVAMAQGAWYQGTRAGEVDQGGCLNALTKYHPTPVSKGNPQHTIRVKVTA
ncbi:DMSO/selenate family reductase complex A subunit [Ferrimonas balearica]|uniref:DMSO/selenate family reductase complex A subunit n=1 Tax=Ferrimonas balearica TaxID=44012 RepID=UPI001C98912C|nr:DMSO/selenate family reductase complex A subunit [Ferrimonas balearica]MBY6108528.1 molybdopterin-dependent oxidoreductase [Ferrimonas balearica]MBY6226151.1 molybdopterin-dependent oxidoreductase [Ferrimonas balearica]